MHLKRWITGVVALPIVIYLIYKGGFFFAGLIMVVSLVSLFEYFKIALVPPEEKMYGIIPILGFITAPAMVMAAHRNGPEIALTVLAFNLLLVGFISIVHFKNNPRTLEIIRKQALGLLYVPTLLSFLVLLRNGPDGMKWIFFVIAVIFAGDTGAFYAGTHLGKHKLCPSVSPGKTIEGAVGGLLANVLVGSLIKLIFFPFLTWSHCILFFILAGMAGQVGDLFESALKRLSGVKDSGYILPGHGGILDRIDALLFAAPIAYFFMRFSEFGL